MPEALLRDASHPPNDSPEKPAPVEIAPVHQGASAEALDYGVTLSVRAICRVLLCVTIVLLSCHTALSVYHYRVEELPWLLRQLFDLDEENNLPTWFSQFLLLGCASLVGLHAAALRAKADRWAMQWTILAVGFLLMAVDEVAGVHETINSVIEISWAIPAAVAVLVLGAAFIPFLRALPPRVALGFAAAGCIYLGGALGVEIFGNEMVASDLEDTLQYSLATLLEEGLEMLGLVCFATLLLRHMRTCAGAGAGAEAEAGAEVSARIALR